jgi:hypothetical protein
MDETLMCHKRQLGRKHKLQRCNRIANHGERCNTCRKQLTSRHAPHKNGGARSQTTTRLKTSQKYREHGRPRSPLRNRYTHQAILGHAPQAVHVPRRRQCFAHFNTNKQMKPRANTKHACKPQTSDLPQASPQAPPRPANVDTPPSNTKVTNLHI